MSLFPQPVVARSLLAILTKQSPCHYSPSPSLRGHFLLSPLPVVARSLILNSPRSNLRVTITPSRRCEVPSCYSHEAISVSLHSPHICGAVQETLSLRKGSQNYDLPSARHYLIVGIFNNQIPKKNLRPQHIYNL